MRPVVLLSTIVLVLLFASCTNTEDRNVNSEEQLSQTPNVLQEDNNYFSGSGGGSGNLLRSSSKRGYRNIIEELFNEAKQKNKELNELVGRIDQQPDNYRDSLMSYDEYSRTNQDYWNSSNNYIAQIKDTILRDEVKEIFKLIRDDYQNKIVAYQDQIGRVNEKRTSLDDQVRVLKLITSLDMMKNYQNNELPPIDQLQNLEEDYDGLIKQVDEMMNLE